MLESKICYMHAIQENKKDKQHIIIMKMVFATFRHVAAACLIMGSRPEAVRGQEMSPPCITTLDDLYFGERDVVDSSTLRKYILCPNTTFELANTFDDDGLAVDGDNPIVIGRPNVHVLCGDDGNSEDNCTLTGGRIQLAIFDEFESEIPANNCLVQGLTFSNAKTTSINVLANRNGNVVFQDCIFSVSWTILFALAT